MRRGTIINKKRIIDTCVAKGNDIRSVAGEYPVFEYRQGSYFYPRYNGSGELLLRSSIVKDNNILHTRLQIVTLEGTFGDNLQRNNYPAGTLELHQRMHKTQNRNLQVFNFEFGYATIFASYMVSYIDLSKFKKAKLLNTSSVSIERVSFCNLVGAKLLTDLTIKRHNFINIDISDNTLLEYIELGRDNGSIQQIVTNSSIYNTLKLISVGNNKLLSFNINAPNLETLEINDNTSLIALTITSYLALKKLYVYNCGLTSLNVSNNVNLTELRIGYLFYTNNNNLGTNLIGLYNLVNLVILDLGGAGVIMNNFDLDVFPKLQEFKALSSTAITGNILSTFVNNNITTIDLRNGSIKYFNTNHTPNLEGLYTTGIDQIDFTVLTKLTGFTAYTTTSGTLKIIDLRNNTKVLTDFRVFTNTIIEKIYLPNMQVTSLTAIYNNSKLDTLVLNGISRTNTQLYISNLALATLDTSFSATNCFPNLTELALGGTNDTYIATKVFDDRKNNLITLVVSGTHFQVNGNIGTTILTGATLINVEGDSSLSYTGSGTFGATMKRVALRPKVGSGLATDGNQVANLIIALSLKDWAVAGSINIGGVIYTNGVIDLRGNCAVATPSTALTTALSLLTTKGVSVLRN